MNDYFSLPNQMKYMHTSQFKNFLKCEGGALAQLNGTYTPETTIALLIGSYVDAYFSNELDEFKNKHPELYTQKNELRAEFKHAEKIIARIKRDKMFMEYMSGEPQVVIEGYIGGVLCRGKIDSLHRDKIVDLKVMKDFEMVWEYGEQVHFIESFGYDIQGAIYQELESQIHKRKRKKKLPFYIATATKEKEPDIEIFQIPQDRLDYCLDYVEHYIERFAKIKTGEIEPGYCGHCDYCKSIKVLTKPKDYKEIF